LKKFDEKSCVSAFGYVTTLKTKICQKPVRIFYWFLIEGKKVSTTKINLIGKGEVYLRKR
jgi:hypothetical protein